MIGSLQYTLCSLHISLVAHTARAYPGFHSIKRLGVLLLLLDGMLVHCRLPPTFCQVSLTVCWYPFIQLGGERHLAQEHSTMTQPALEPGYLDPESSMLTTRPPHLCVRGMLSLFRIFMKN